MANFHRNYVVVAMVVGYLSILIHFAGISTPYWFVERENGYSGGLWQRCVAVGDASICGTYKGGHRLAAAKALETISFCGAVAGVVFVTVRLCVHKMADIRSIHYSSPMFLLIAGVMGLFGVWSYCDENLCKYAGLSLYCAVVACVVYILVVAPLAFLADRFRVDGG